ncbi:MAG: M20/M25/M40 family metallo-hydrolase, partial [Clostridia bacterium]|nr:M20/M25/M40 family metallo-hydrolase [Clostridia bacterium]
DMLGIIKEFDEVRRSGEHPPMWDNAVSKRMVVVTKVKAGEVKPHGQLGVPMDAFVECSVQSYPGETRQDVLGALTAFINERFDYPELVSVTPMYNYVAPGDSDAQGEGVGALEYAAAHYMDEIKVTAAPFPCDFFAFEQYGNMEGAIFGPIGGNLHAPDEWVDIDSVKALTKTLMSMIVSWCG